MVLNEIRQGIEQRHRHEVIQRSDGRVKPGFGCIPHRTEFTPRGLKFPAESICGDAGGFAFKPGLDLVDG